MFADMVHISKASSGECFMQQNNTNVTNTTLQYGGDTFHPALEIYELSGFEDLLSGLDLSNPFCSNDLKQSYLSLFLIITGNLDVSAYDESSLSQGLFIVFLFLVMIVLLNCLIALVIDSYEQSKTRARMHFGRARVQFAAQKNAFMKQLQKGQCEFSGDCSLVNCIKRCMLCSYRWIVLSQIIFATFTVISAIVSISVLFPEYKNGVYNENFVTTIFYVEAIILGISLVVVLDFMFEGCYKSCLLFRSVRKLVVHILRKITSPSVGKLSRTLGITPNETDYDVDEFGRISAMERDTIRTVQESEQRLTKLIKSLQCQTLTMTANLEKIHKKQHSRVEPALFSETASNEDSMSSVSGEFRRSELLDNSSAD